MFATIRRGASGDGYFAVPEEGSSFFISNRQFSLLGLSEDQELTEERFFSIRHAVLAFRCRDKALSLLALREHSRFELRTKLLKKDFPSSLVDEQLAMLEEENLLSDHRFAEQFVQFRQRKHPEGRFLLQGRLAERGVPRDIIAEVLDTWFSDEDAVDRAVLLAARKMARKGDGELAMRHLRTLGFTPAEIRRALGLD